MQDTHLVTGALILPFALGLTAAACSDSPPDRPADTSNSIQLAVTAGTPGSPTGSDGGGAPPGAADESGPAPNVPYAYAVPVPPGTLCAIKPEGSTDSTHLDTLYSEPDGEVRFSLAPQAKGWGARLTLDCGIGADAGSRSTYLVDLNDRSTFKAKFESDLRPHIVRTRPALAGDPSTVSPEDLRRGGYPPRPDPIAQPERYDQWAKKVSKAMDVYNTVPIALIGYKATGQYEGTDTGNALNNPWTGIVQAAGGFSTVSGSPVRWANLLGDVLYEEYEAQLWAPFNFSDCATEGCGNQGMWVGIGGSNSQWQGNDFVPDLIQSGFVTIPFASGQTVFPFAEFTGPTSGQYFGAAHWFFPAGKFAQGDTFTIWGWAADASCNLNDSPSQGCFWHEDDTNDWVQETTQPFPVDSNGNPVGFWLPTTLEYVNEYGGPGYNENYYANIVEGMGWDSSGNFHPDPGAANATDPFYYSVETDLTGRQCSSVLWNTQSGAISSPQDPMAFVPQTCGN